MLKCGKLLGFKMYGTEDLSQFVDMKYVMVCGNLLEAHFSMFTKNG